MRHFGGPTAAREADTARVSTAHDISEAFHLVDRYHSGLLDASGECVIIPCTKIITAHPHPISFYFTLLMSTPYFTYRCSTGC